MGEKTNTNEATKELLSLCHASGDWNPDPQAVAACVRAGANIFFRDEKMHDPLLATLTSKGRVEAVRACLEHFFSPAQQQQQQVLDLTITGDGSRTALHWIFERGRSDEDVKALVAVYVESIARAVEAGRPCCVRFGQEDWEGENVLSRASRHQQLSLVWPLVKPLILCPPPLHVGGGGAGKNDSDDGYGVKRPIPLHGEIWQWDFDALGEEDKALFTFRNLVECDETDSQNRWRMTSRSDKHATRVIAGHRASALLYRASLLLHPNVDVVRRCVEEGADIVFSSPDLCSPVLNALTKDGHIECVRACLATSRAVDFTKFDFAGGTPLRYICFGSQNGAEKVAALLHAYLDRLLNPRYSTDKIDWENVDSMCGHFCSLAAFCGFLAVTTRVLKERGVPFFMDAGTTKPPIPLTNSINENDWNALSDEDKHRFDRSQAHEPMVYHLDGPSSRHCNNTNINTLF